MPLFGFPRERAVPLGLRTLEFILSLSVLFMSAYLAKLNSGDQGLFREDDNINFPIGWNVYSLFYSVFGVVLPVVLWTVDTPNIWYSIIEIILGTLFSFAFLGMVVGSQVPFNPCVPELYKSLEAHPNLCQQWRATEVLDAVLGFLFYCHAIVDFAIAAQRFRARRDVELRNVDSGASFGDRIAFRILYGRAAWEKYKIRGENTDIELQPVQPPSDRPDTGTTLGSGVPRISGSTMGTSETAPTSVSTQSEAGDTEAQQQSGSETVDGSSFGAKYNQFPGHIGGRPASGPAGRLVDDQRSSYQPPIDPNANRRNTVLGT